MIVLDASAVVSIMAREPDSEALAQRLDAISAQARPRFASTVTVWEAACAVARIWRTDRAIGLRAVNEFLEISKITPVAPDIAITARAVQAAESYGLGRGYPGILNLGDCFSYATAKHLGAALLFKGEDFGRTDIAVA